MASDGEILWEPDARMSAECRMGRYLNWLCGEHGHEFAGYDELWKWSTEDLEGFWQSIWEYFEVTGDGDISRVIEDETMPGAEWFPAARLNYAENMLRGDENQVVLTALSQTRERIELTRGQLREQVARAAGGLRLLGVRPGDRVVAYLPNIPEALIAMLATASLGAVWAVCAPELGSSSVIDRLQQLDPKVFLTVDGYYYGDKAIDRRDEVARIRAELPTITATVQVRYLHETDLLPEAILWDDLLAGEAEPRFERVPFGYPLWVLFSSGTTGLPKAIVHSHGGITLELQKALGLHSDLGPQDRYFVFCTTTWVMWNIQVSALLLGAAITLFDGNPSFPRADALWSIVEDEAVTVFGAGAAFLTSCRKAGQVPGRDFDLSRLRGIFSTGSPLPAAGFRWVYEAVSPSVFLQSTSGGTDVCTSFVGGAPLLPVRAGEIAAPALGVLAQAFDAAGHPVVDQLGELVISKPMPSMPISFWNDPGGTKYQAAYFDHFPGKWRHGDWVVFNERGSCTISGRSDGTLNRGGVRLGTSEFYSVLENLPGIDDSLVVHLDDPDGGMGSLVLFVHLQQNTRLDEALRGRIARELRERLSPRHVPDEVIAVPDIPYNLTGKKLEVPVKRILRGTPRHDVVSDGAVRNPASLDVFERLCPRFAASATTA
ncbi:acetoacetate--CoA ligase [Streptomyces ipomoeae]|uniref:acetoacetate--CoA ligase n=1 Tax=Streptomyces ipomoeae TaxID=103232 RepID=UPI00114784EB|nr:acetoacetate--CoA ligase [Streptomyces ipomoeae]